MKIEFSFNEILDKYKKVILAVLLLLVVAMSSYLLWRENYGKPELTKKVAELEERVKALEGKKEEIATAPLEAMISASTVSASASSSVVSTTVPKESKSSTKISGKININTAGAAELDLLPGIGLVYAQRIIDYRNTHGNFGSIEEIKKIKGIGDATFNKIKEQITI